MYYVLCITYSVVPNVRLWPCCGAPPSQLIHCNQEDRIITHDYSSVDRGTTHEAVFTRTCTHQTDRYRDLSPFLEDVLDGIQFFLACFKKDGGEGLEELLYDYGLCYWKKMWRSHDGPYEQVRGQDNVLL
jgi:hypothetical protein